jgi:hypothetical protein
VQFNDLAGAAVDSEAFDDTDVIKAHTKVTYDARMQYNEYTPDTVRLRNAKASDLKAVFYPHGMILRAFCTELRMPAAPKRGRFSIKP